MTLDDALSDCPLVAILRGVRPGEIVETCEALFTAGFRVVEVPMNSPGPLESVALAAQALVGRMSVGAGTVLSPAVVESAMAAGARFVVSPNADPAVIGRAVQLGLGVLPGFATASEAFVALAAGARHLKLFPAGTYGPGHLKALKAVLPPEAGVFPVGGVGPSAMADWLAAGAAGFGLGSELYRPGQSPAETREKAQPCVAAFALATTGA